MLVRSVGRVDLLVGDMPSLVNNLDVKSSVCSLVNHFGTLTKPCFKNYALSASESTYGVSSADGILSQNIDLWNMLKLVEL